MKSGGTGERDLDKKILGLVVAIIVICTSGTVVILSSLLTSAQQPTGALDFSVTGSSDCLRFLNSSVPAVYVPFTTAANTNWQLTINCTKMSGGANGYTDIYIYKGYWNGGSNYTCTSNELYPILNDIECTNQQIRLGSPVTETYGGSAQKSYTIFFVFPPGGQQSTFNISLKQL